MSEPLLDIRNLTVEFPVRGEGRRVRLRAVDDVSLSIREGEILGLVGESGCGKSTVARAVAGLVHPASGAVVFDGQDLAVLSPRQRRAARADIQMVFQDPFASLNPRLTVGDALAEAVCVRPRHHGVDVKLTVRELLERVGMDPAQARRYPHELSGGQRQRIAIARALATAPRMLLADEPVSALDVSIQAQILNLLQRLRIEMRLTMLFVSHDLSVVHYLSDWIAVMYLGRIVETGPASEVFERPAHPYAQALIAAVPAIRRRNHGRKAPAEITGDPPSPVNPPSGCSFHPRCPYAAAECADRQPPPMPVEDSSNHTAACLRLKQVEIASGRRRTVPTEEYSSSSLPGI